MRVTRRYDGHGQLTGTTVTTRSGCLAWAGGALLAIGAFFWPLAAVPGWPRWPAEGAWLLFIFAAYAVRFGPQHRPGSQAKQVADTLPDDTVQLPKSWDDPGAII